MVFMMTIKQHLREFESFFWKIDLARKDRSKQSLDLNCLAQQIIANIKLVTIETSTGFHFHVKRTVSTSVYWSFDKYKKILETLVKTKPYPWNDNNEKKIRAIFRFGLFGNWIEYEISSIKLNFRQSQFQLPISRHCFHLAHRARVVNISKKIWNTYIVILWQVVSVELHTNKEHPRFKFLWTNVKCKRLILSDLYLLNKYFTPSFFLHLHSYWLPFQFIYLISICNNI